MLIPRPPPLPPVIVPARRIFQEVAADIHHTDLYVYSYLKPVQNLTFTVGASEDIVNTNKLNLQDTSQFNPKLGILWNPFPSTTVRGAAFKTLKRTLITDQTLEPTQVAGFNQFFDDVQWNAGMALWGRCRSEIYAKHIRWRRIFPEGSVSSIF